MNVGESEYVLGWSVLGGFEKNFRNRSWPCFILLPMHLEISMVKFEGDTSNFTVAPSGIKI